MTPFVQHERMIGAVLYVLAGCCFSASLVAFVRTETGWSLAFAVAFAALVGLVWNIEDRRYAE